MPDMALALPAAADGKVRCVFLADLHAEPEIAPAFESIANELAALVDVVFFEFILYPGDVSQLSYGAIKITLQSRGVHGALADEYTSAYREVASEMSRRGKAGVGIEDVAG